MIGKEEVSRATTGLRTAEARVIGLTKSENDGEDLYYAVEH